MGRAPDIVFYRPRHCDARLALLSLHPRPFAQRTLLAHPTAGHSRSLNALCTQTSRRRFIPSPLNLSLSRPLPFAPRLYASRPQPFPVHSVTLRSPLNLRSNLTRSQSSPILKWLYALPVVLRPQRTETRVASRPEYANGTRVWNMRNGE